MHCYVPEFDISIAGGFQLGSTDVCSQVRYIGVHMMKGDSAELSSEQIGPDSSNYRMVPCQFKCFEGIV